MNKSTYNIIKNKSHLKFSHFLEIQCDELQENMDDINVGISFVSLLTVCSDSYHTKQKDVDIKEINLIKQNKDDNDFYIDIITKN